MSMATYWSSSSQLTPPGVSDRLPAARATTPWTVWEMGTREACGYYIRWGRYGGQEGCWENVRGKEGCWRSSRNTGDPPLASPQ